MVCEEGRVEVEELGLMSSGPSVHTSSRVPKARRQSRTLGLRFSQYSNSCRVDKLHLMMCVQSGDTLHLVLYQTSCKV